MKKKLFFVINNLQGGGAERVTSIIANELNRQGFEIFIVCLNQAESAFEIDNDIKIISLIKGRGKAHILNRIKYGGLIYLRLIRLLIQEKPYFAISFMTTANLWTGLTCSLCNVPFVVSERTTPDRTVNSLNYFLRMISFLIYQKSKAIVVPASGIAVSIKKNKSYRNLNNFELIRNPVNIFPKPSNIPVNERGFILAVGRLNTIKGFDLLIDAYSKIKSNNFDLIIVGDGKEYENLRTQIEKLGLSDVIKLAGSKDNLQDYYHQATLFVLPSRNEGYPNALIEAMSFGCPSVAVDCEFGPSEIIENGVNGILVEQYNVNALVSAIDHLLINKSLREKLANNAQLIKETNSLKNISTRWSNLILDTNY